MSKPKITRNALKAVIKECLIEILAEGITPGVTPKKGPAKKRKAPSRASQPKASREFNTAVSNTASKLTSDPVMAAIFEDTARTTLQEQREGSGAMMSTATPELQSTPEEDPGNLFEGSSNWATLAFAEKKPV